MLNVAVLETSLYSAIAGFQAPNDHEDGSGKLREELTTLEAEIGRLAQAIAGGGEIPALVAAMQERERRCSHLRAEVAAVERQASVRRDTGEVAHVLDVMREALTDWQGILRQETGPARRAMQALLQGRLMFTPQEGFYTFEGAGTISPVIAGAVGLQKGVVAPAGRDRTCTIQVRDFITRP